MRYSVSILFAITLLCFTNCKQNKNQTKTGNTEKIKVEDTPPKVSKIILSLNGCEGTCPIENIQINKNLDIILFVKDGHRDNSIGFYIGKIDTKKWDSIASMVNSIDFNQYQNNYYTGQDDESYSLRIEAGRFNNLIGGNKSDLPKPILELVEIIIKTYTTANLKHVPIDSTYIKSNAFLSEEIRKWKHL